MTSAPTECPDYDWPDFQSGDTIGNCTYVAVNVEILTASLQNATKELDGYILGVFLDDLDNTTTLAERALNSTATSLMSHYRIWTPATIVRVVLYVVIFLFSFTGNSLVIATLVKNKRMRTVTNVFLFNLAVSDLLLGVFCMPFTLIGTLLRNFIFGKVMCRLIPYFQAVSVSVNVWTLVGISLERFFAICRPLQSRQWQTVSHAYRTISIIWILSLTLMLPIAYLNQLLPTRTPGKVKCREVWPSALLEQVFNIYLDVALLLLPLILMTVVYSQVARILTSELRMTAGTSEAAGIPMSILVKDDDDSIQDTESKSCGQSKTQKAHTYEQTSMITSTYMGDTPSQSTEHQLIIRATVRKSQDSKRRITLMLFVLVIEFFVCWTPLYVINTWCLFDAQQIYRTLGLPGISIIHLLAYTSSCCNPITYCFMHQKFREGFRSTLSCHEGRTPSVRRSGTSGAGCSASGSKNSML